MFNQSKKQEPLPKALGNLILEYACETQEDSEKRCKPKGISEKKHDFNYTIKALATPTAIATLVTVRAGGAVFEAADRSGINPIASMVAGVAAGAIIGMPLVPVSLAVGCSAAAVVGIGELGFLAAKKAWNPVKKHIEKERVKTGIKCAKFFISTDSLREFDPTYNPEKQNISHLSMK